MSNATEYKQAIAQAQANLADVCERRADAIGGDALELMREILTPEEIAASDIKVADMIKELATPA